MKTIKAKLILLFVTVAFTFTACGSESSESKIISSAKEIIDKDLADDASINKCLYNKVNGKKCVPCIIEEIYI